MPDEIRDMRKLGMLSGQYARCPECGAWAAGQVIFKEDIPHDPDCSRYGERADQQPQIRDYPIIDPERINPVTEGLRDAAQLLGGVRNPGPTDLPERPTLNELAQAINRINAQNGWKVIEEVDWDNGLNLIPASLALIHSEISEALEAFREGSRPGFEEELADIIIRTLDLAGGLGIDIDNEIAKKLEKNRGRGYRHGGKRI